MLSIRRLFVDQRLAPGAEPNPLERAVQLDLSELPMWVKQPHLSPSQKENYTWKIAELRWMEVMFQALSAYYGILDVPPFKLTNESVAAHDKGAVSHWRRQLVANLKQENDPHMWQMQVGGRSHNGISFVSIYHPRRKVSDWLLWKHRSSLDLRFHPSVEEGADEMVEALFKPMQYFLLRSGFPVLEGLPIEVTYERDHLGLRVVLISEFFADVGIPMWH